MQSKDIDTPQYSLGALFHEKIDIETYWGIGFIVDMLTNQNSGILTSWMRKEKGWSYEVLSSQWLDKDRTGWIIDVSLPDEVVANEIRKEIHERIQKALNSKMLVDEAIHTMIKSSCFSYQKLSERMDFAANYIESSEYIPSEKELLTWISAVTPRKLNALYERFFSPEVTGELLVLPKALGV
jgi:predicted Zn-dependent peptidase